MEANPFENSAPPSGGQPAAPNTLPKPIHDPASPALPTTPPTTSANASARSQLPGGSGHKDPKPKKRVNYEDGTHDMPDPLLLQLRKRYDSRCQVRLPNVNNIFSIGLFSYSIFRLMGEKAVMKSMCLQAMRTRQMKRSLLCLNNQSK